MTKPEYDFADLVDAWLAERRWAHAHPDLAEYHAGRYGALAAAFGEDLNSPPKSPPPLPDWMDRAELTRGGMPESMADRWSDDVHRFVLTTEEKNFRFMGGPFSGYLEAPPSLSLVRRRYGAGLTRCITDLHNETKRMLVELLAALYPHAAKRTVSEADVRAQGFDPSALAPDPDDYW